MIDRHHRLASNVSLPAMAIVPKRSISIARMNPSRCRSSSFEYEAVIFLSHEQPLSYSSRGLVGASDNLREYRMPHPSSDHHNKAAAHHENAARSHRDAAKSYDEGKHETGAHHAQAAQGHSSQANEESTHASRKHAQEHGSGKH